MLIKTKLQTAQLRSRMLLREPLINGLRRAEEYPLILITGPAGSGKSLLVGQWIKREKLKAAWYSLDEEDNEPDLFFRYLLTALVRLIQYIPANLRLVILSRYRLPAPIDALTFKKERLELSAADLKFTEKETADLFKKDHPPFFFS